jgi:phosphate starvation-inducible protein PhoH
MGKSNRQRVQDNKVKTASKYAEKVIPFQVSNDWKLDWFTPEGGQNALVESMQDNVLTAGNGPSGTGKTSTVLWQALHWLKSGIFQKIVFIKNPTEAGDDQIGYLKGEQQDKLKAHFHETRRIFQSFISKGKLECDESSGKIEFAIPNFLLGATIDNAVIIIDECQTMSPGTMKLLMERVGMNSIVVILGDSRQAYSVKKREDGFADFIKKITKVEEDGSRVSSEPLMGYVELKTDDNKRSALSKRITELYA